MTRSSPRCLEQVGGDVERCCSRNARAEYVTAPPAIGADRLPPVPARAERRDATCRRSGRGPARAARRARRPRPGPASSRDPGRGASAGCTPTRCRRPRAPSGAGSPPISPPAPGMIASWKSGGPGAASMNVANPSPRMRPSARAAACRARPVLEVGDLERALERRARRHADVERGPVSIRRGQLVGADRCCGAGSRRDRCPARGAAMSSMRSRTQVSTAHGSAVGDVGGLVRRGQRGREPERREGGTDPGIIVRIISGYIAALNGNAGYAPWSIAHVHAHAEQRAVVAERGLDVERLLARLARDRAGARCGPRST